MEAIRCLNSFYEASPKRINRKMHAHAVVGPLRPPVRHYTSLPPRGQNVDQAPPVRADLDNTRYIS